MGPPTEEMAQYARGAERTWEDQLRDLRPRERDVAKHHAVHYCSGDDFWQLDLDTLGENVDLDPPEDGMDL